MSASPSTVVVAVSADSADAIENGHHAASIVKMLEDADADSQRGLTSKLRGSREMSGCLISSRTEVGIAHLPGRGYLHKRTPEF